MGKLAATDPVTRPRRPRTVGMGVEPSTMRQEQAALVVIGVAVLDAVVILGNVMHSMAPYSDLLTGREAWNGTFEGSYAEMLGHAQLLLAAVLLMMLWRRQRSPVYAAWAALLLTVVADDFLAIHETVGGWLVRVLDLPDIVGLRPQDLGELAVWAVLGVALLLLLAVAHVRSPAADRRITWVLGRLLVLLAVFAVALDMVAVIVERLVPVGVTEAATILETTGELMVMSAILVCVHGITLQPGDHLKV